MPRYSAPINSQRLNAPLVIDLGGPPSLLPLLAVSSVLTSAVEGTTLSYLVTRTRNSGGTLVFKYLVDSTGDFAHFPPDQPLEANVTVGPDVLTYTVQVRTLDRDGLQGDRTIILDIEAVSGCEIDPARTTAYTTLTDNPEDPDDPNWFKTLPYTSGKALALGTSYFTDWLTYTTECNDVDSFHGDHFGTANAFVQTWDQIQGGPLGNTDAIQANGQLGWNSNITTFSKPFREVPVNTAWVFHNFTVVPFDMRTDSGVAGAKTAIWDEIIAGDHDQRFQEFGTRIAALFLARGIDLKYYIGCMCAKPQAADVYRIYASTKLLYKQACDRVYAQMRIGSGNPFLRFAFAPTHLRTYQGEDYGPLADWCPDTCDAIGIAFHPNSFCTNRTRYDTLMNGNANYYGIVGDVHALAVTKELPLAVFEWSPRFETCPIANDVYGWFYNEFLVPNAPVLVAANIFSEQTFNPDAADAQGSAAAAQWELGVNTFKTLFGDPSVVPEAVVRIEATAVGKVVEGNPLTFNIKRNVPVTKACSVRWTATSSRAPGDLTGTVSGLTSFTAEEATLSKPVTVNTADLSATEQGDRTITVTLNTPTTCSIDPTKAQATTVIEDFVSGVIDTAYIYKNPFNKDAAHHRPIGLGLIYQVQGSVSQTDGPPTKTGAGSTYRPNPGPVFKSGDTSPLVTKITALPNSGYFGELNAGGGSAQGIKYYYFVPNEADKQQDLIIAADSGRETITFPQKDYLSGPTEKLLKFHTGDGDNVLSLYPEDGSASIGAMFIYMNNYNATPNPDECKRIDRWPIDKLDYEIGNRAAGGSGMRFPSGFTRGNNLRKSPPYFGHALQMVIPRQSGASPGDAKLSIIQMSDGNVWPSVAQDSGADAADRPPGTVVTRSDGTTYVLQYGDKPNSGWIPYGQLFVIPSWFWGLRNSRPGNTVTLADYPGITWSLNLSDIGLALFDALCDYGVRALDGNGQGVTGPEGKAYGRFELRLDQDVVSTADGTALSVELDAELNKICPPVSGSATRWKQNLLFPVAGIRDYTGETERDTGGDGLCYVGGGGRGRVFPNCVNTAYDAPVSSGSDYTHVADITLPIWASGAGSMTNFLLPFVAIADELKTVANGGKVQNSSGFDIIFQTAGGTVIPHKDVRYDGAVGYVVKLLNFSRNFSTAQTIKMFIGKAGVTASQQNVAGATAGGWLAIYFGNGTDLTGNNRTLNSHGSPITTFQGNFPAQQLDASGTDYFSTPGATSWMDNKSALSVVCYQDINFAEGKKSEVFNVASDTNVTALSLHHNAATPATHRWTFIIKFGTAAALQYQSEDGTAGAKAIAVVAQTSAKIKMAGDGYMFAAAAGQDPTAGATSTNINDDLEWGAGGPTRTATDPCEGNISFLAIAAGTLSNSAMESMTAAFGNSTRPVYTIGAFSET